MAETNEPQVVEQPVPLEVPPKRNGKVGALEKQLLATREELDKLREEYEELRKQGWDERHQRVLRVLKHFYMRIVNLPCSCTADRKRLDEIVEEAQWTLKGNSQEKV